jgi:hypothetical protein
VNCCPSNLLSGSTLPPSPFPVSKYTVYKIHTVYRQLVAGGGMLSSLGDHNLQEFITTDTRLRIYKIARLPQTKTLEGGASDR